MTVILVEGERHFMLNRIIAMFQGTAAPTLAQTHTNRVALATCVVLLEAARIDDEFTASERRHILEVLQARFALPEDEAEELLRDAQQARDQSNDLWRFTNRINTEFPVPEKIAILEEVWRILYSDGVLRGHEDHLVHKLQQLLNLNHPQLIAAKMKVLGEIRTNKERGNG